MNKLFVNAREQEREEDEARKDEILKQMDGILDQLEVFQTQAWDKVEDMVRGWQQEAFIDIMNAGVDEVMLARERARIYGKILQRKIDLEQELDRLRSEKNALED